MKLLIRLFVLILVFLLFAGFGYAALTIDVNIVAPVTGNYIRGTYTIDFNWWDSNTAAGTYDANLYYTDDDNAAGTFEFLIASDVNLLDENGDTGGTYGGGIANYDYNWDTTAVSTDGNYFIEIKIWDGNGETNSDYGTEFMIDNTGPVTSWDGNTTWQNFDANIHLTCNDGAGAGCGVTMYRVDTNATDGVNYGSWQTYDTNILISSFATSDGNWAIDFNSTDLAVDKDDKNGTGDLNTFYVLFDETNPSVTITNTDYSTDVGSYTLEYSGSDATSGVANYWVKADSDDWIDNNSNTSYEFDLSSGSHTLYVIAGDEADNNSSQDSITITVNLGGGGGYSTSTEEEEEEEEVSEVVRQTILERNIVKFPTREHIQRILTAAGASPTAIEKAMLGRTKISTSRKVKVVKETTEGRVSYKSTITMEIKNLGKLALKNVKVVESIPKSVAETASMISSNTRFSVLKEDPIIEFTIPAIETGGTTTISYSISDKVETAALEEFDPIVVSDFTEEAAPTEEEEIAPGVKKPAAKPTANYTTLIVTIIIIVLIVLILAYYFLRPKSKSKNPLTYLG